VISDRLYNSHVMATRLFVLLHNLLCAMVQLWCVVVKFCVTVQTVALSDAVFCVLWRRFMFIVVQFVQLSDSVVCVCCGAVCCLLFCS
jgi:hypothetical protein